MKRRLPAKHFSPSINDCCIIWRMEKPPVCVNLHNDNFWMSADASSAYKCESFPQSKRTLIAGLQSMAWRQNVLDREMCFLIGHTALSSTMQCGTCLCGSKHHRETRWTFYEMIKNTDFLMDCCSRHCLSVPSDVNCTKPKLLIKLTEKNA